MSSSRTLTTSLSLGLSGGLSTILSQAYGAQDFDLMNLTAQRGVLLLLLTCIPISIIWILSDLVLVAVGQDQGLALRTRLYLCSLLPGIWCNAVSICIMQWLYSMKRTRPVAVVSVVVALLSPIWNYLFIHTLKIGYSGAALAVSTSRFIELLGLVLFLRCSSLMKDNKFEFSKRSLTGAYVISMS
jgi:multidrug resistance protein, MATE family